MRNKSNINSVLEVFWLLVFIITLIAGIYNSLTKSLKDSYMFFIMAAMSLALYLARRSLRKKMQNN